MSDLWTEASRDVEAEQVERAIVTAKTAAASFWPFLAAAVSVDDYLNRADIASERIAAAAAQGGIPASMLESELERDWRTYLGSRKQAADDDSDDSGDGDGDSDDSGGTPYYVVDSDSGKDVGGPYDDKAAAQAAIDSGDISGSNLSVQQGSGDDSGGDGGDDASSAADGGGDGGADDDPDDDSDDSGGNPFAKGSRRVTAAPNKGKCGVCGKGIIQVDQPGNNSAWQHDIESGAGVAHQAVPEGKQTKSNKTAEITDGANPNIVGQQQEAGEVLGPQDMPDLPGWAQATDAEYLPPGFDEAGVAERGGKAEASVRKTANHQYVPGPDGDCIAKPGGGKVPCGYPKDHQIHDTDPKHADHPGFRDHKTSASESHPPGDLTEHLLRVHAVDPKLVRRYGDQMIHQRSHEFLTANGWNSTNWDTQQKPQEHAHGPGGELMMEGARKVALEDGVDPLEWLQSVFPQGIGEPEKPDGHNGVDVPGDGIPSGDGTDRVASRGRLPFGHQAVRPNPKGSGGGIWPLGMEVHQWHPLVAPLPDSVLRGHKLAAEKAMLPNPNHEGSPHAHEWFHGTTANYEGPPRHSGPDTGIQSHYNDWNSYTGAHFGSLHQMAAGYSRQGGRVIHANLHIANPKTYYDSYEMTNDAHKRLVDAGHLEHHPDGYTRSRQLLAFARQHGMGAYRDSLRADGHDGIVYHNTIDTPHGSECAIAFEPHDISVTGSHPAKQQHGTPADDDAERFGGQPFYSTASKTAQGDDNPFSSGNNPFSGGNPYTQPASPADSSAGPAAPDPSAELAPGSSYTGTTPETTKPRQIPSGGGAPDMGSSDDTADSGVGPVASKLMRENPGMAEATARRIAARTLTLVGGK